MTNNAQPWTITVEKRLTDWNVPYFTYEATRDSDGATVESEDMPPALAPLDADEALRRAREAIDTFVDLESSKRTVRYIPEEGA